MVYLSCQPVLGGVNQPGSALVAWPIINLWPFPLVSLGEIPEPVHTGVIERVVDYDILPWLVKVDDT
jgi:hypothetical protein